MSVKYDALCQLWQSSPANNYVRRNKTAAAMNVYDEVLYWSRYNSNSTLTVQDLCAGGGLLYNYAPYDPTSGAAVPAVGFYNLVGFPPQAQSVILCFKNPGTGEIDPAYVPSSGTYVDFDRTARALGFASGAQLAELLQI